MARIAWPPKWPPDRSTVLFVAAAGASAYWTLGSILGVHPDGALLGFSGTMWAIWAASTKEDDHAHKRKQRTHSPRRVEILEDRDQGE